MNIRGLSRRLTTAIMQIEGCEMAIDRSIGVGINELCMLYALDDGKAHSQRQIAENWCIPRTTLNAIIKRWEGEGLLTLHKIRGKRREMEIKLTAAGHRRAETLLAPTYTAEDEALRQTVEKYGTLPIEALEYYAAALRRGQKGE